MNHYVPDFDMDDDYSFPTSSALTRPKKSSMLEDDVMELLWQNGEVVMQSQNQRSVRKYPPSKFDGTIPVDQSTAREIRPSQQEEEQQLFIQENEMASWLHYPLVDDTSMDHSFCADFLYPTPTQCSSHDANTNASGRANHELRPSSTATTVVTPRPPISPIRRTDAETRMQSFGHFSRHASRVESGPSSTKIVGRDPTVVDSSVSPSVRPQSRVPEIGRTVVSEANNGDLGRGIITGSGVVGTSSGGGGGKETTTCEMTVTSSPNDSSASADPASEKTAVDDRKRKGREADDIECHSEDMDFGSTDAKKQVRRSTSSKRSRAAEVHNLSERRRRDRINEKMKALQELIPRCNKSDKASMLDEAIEYLKSLQLQVQMMSMGCGMMPMMFPGVQPYMPPMGMGMGMGMNRPMMPFPNLVAGSTIPTQAGAAQLGPRFPMPAFHMPHVPVTDMSRIQLTNQTDHMFNPTQNMNQPRVSSFLDAYQQFLGPHQMQLPIAPISQQNQPAAQPSTSKTGNSRAPENPKNS